MDLRQFSIPSNIRDFINKDKAGNSLMWYQPFIFSDDLIVGTSGPWNVGTNSYVCDQSDPESIQQKCIREATILGNWYDKLNQIILESIPSAQTFLDLGCNTGHFCFDLASRGKKCTGVDRWPQSYEIIKNITNIEFEYINSRYCSQTHKVPELENRKFDVVISSAVSTHLIDPHYFIGYLGQLAEKAILLTTPISNYQDPLFQIRIPTWRKENNLPETFEFLPSPSAMELMLYVLKFRYVFRYRYNQKQDPKSTRGWGVWLATNVEPSLEVREKYNLIYVENRFNDFADQLKGILSISKRKEPIHQTSKKSTSIILRDQIKKIRHGLKNLIFR